MANNSIQIRITVSKEINDLLEKAGKKLGKKKSMLARELMEQKLYDLNLIQRKLKDLFLLHPTKSNKAIGIMAGISRRTIGKYRKIYDEQIDQEFVSMTAGKFINEFGKAIDYWKLQIDELEKLKNIKQSIILKNGNITQIRLSAMEILAICKQQAELRKYIIFLGSQGEVREVLKIMRSGKLPVLDR